MVVGSYIPHWVRVFDGVQQLPAITFVINRQHRAYAGKISNPHSAPTTVTPQ